MASQNLDESVSSAISDIPSENSTLYINHVPPELNHDDIRKLCDSYGTVIAVKRYIKPNNVYSHLTYFVTFQTISEAKNALRQLRQNKQNGMHYTFANIVTKNLKGGKVVPTEVQQTVPAERCVKCKSIAKLKCDRCGDPYCSRKCQERDWREHKTICIPMPNLVPLKPTKLNDETEKNRSPQQQSRSHHQHQQQSGQNGQVIKVQQQLPGSHHQHEQQRGQNEQEVKVQQQSSGSQHQQQRRQNEQQTSKNLAQNPYSGGHNNPGTPTETPRAFVSERHNNEVRRHKTPDVSAKKTSFTNDQVLAGVTKAFKTFKANGDNEQVGGLARNNRPTEKTSSTTIAISASNLEVTPVQPDNKVIITHVHNSKWVHVQSLNSNVVNNEVIRSDVQDYNHILNDVDRYCRNTPPPDDLQHLKRGDCIGALNGSRYERGVVISIDEQHKIQVGFLDSHIMPIKVSKNNIRLLTKDLCLRKRHTIRCYLKGIDSIEPTGKLVDYLEQLKIAKTLLTIRYDGEFQIKKHVDMFIVNTGESVNDTLIKLSLPADVPEPANKPNNENDLPDVVQNKSPEYKRLEGNNVTVIVIDSSHLMHGQFACFDSIHREKFCAIKTKIDEYTANDTSEPFSPQIRDIVLARFTDGEWYRAVCIENQKNVKVFFIDFGNIEWIPVSDIRKLPNELLMPCLTSICSIEGLPVEQIGQDSKLYEYLSQFLEKSIVKFDRIEYDDESSIASCYSKSLLDELRKEKLIK